MKQGNPLVIEYYNTMNSFCLEFDYYQDIKKNKIKCNEDAIMLQKFVKREKIFEFLWGLNAKTDQVHVQVLGKEDVLSLSEVFSLIWAEESWRVIMLHIQVTEGSAVVSLK